MYGVGVGGLLKRTPAGADLWRMQCDGVGDSRMSDLRLIRNVSLDRCVFLANSHYCRILTNTIILLLFYKVINPTLYKYEQKRLNFSSDSGGYCRILQLLLSHYHDHCGHVEALPTMATIVLCF